MFAAVYNMSLTASVIIVLVLFVRLLLRRAPRAFSYGLWAVVLFRLLCPVSLSAEFSVLELVDLQSVRAASPMTSRMEYVLPPAPKVPQAAFPPPANVFLRPEAEPQPEPEPVDPLAVIWLAGVGTVALYGLISLGKLRRRLVGAVRLEQNIWLADHIQTAFVLGVFRPKIYLPSSLPEGERRYVLLHERYHIRRLDHIVKLLAFLALCLHWFNPLVWLAFVLAGRDMEMSCDEAVVKGLNAQARADYSAALLRLAAGRTIISGTPLACGAGGTKGRVRNVLRWQRPKAWVLACAGVLCMGVTAACGVNPRVVIPWGWEPGPVAEWVVEHTGQYWTIESYAVPREEEIEYVTTSNQRATAKVLGGMAAHLEKRAEVPDLAPNGVLEGWSFERWHKLDVDDVLLIGGMGRDDDGWYALEPGGHMVIALKYDDDSYDILYDELIVDVPEFFGANDNWEDAIRDWYETNYTVQEPATDEASAREALQRVLDSIREGAPLQLRGTGEQEAQILWENVWETGLAAEYVLQLKECTWSPSVLMSISRQNTLRPVSLSQGGDWTITAYRNMSAVVLETEGRSYEFIANGVYLILENWNIQLQWIAASKEALETIFDRLQEGAPVELRRYAENVERGCYETLCPAERSRELKECAWEARSPVYGLYLDDAFQLSQGEDWAVTAYGHGNFVQIRRENQYYLTEAEGVYSLLREWFGQLKAGA